MNPRISFLGGCALADAKGVPVRLPTRKSWALLAYLAMTGDRDVPREELAALLWPQSSDSKARASLRQELAVLRKAMAAAGLPRVESTKEMVRLDIPDDLVDARQMASLIETATPEAERKAVAIYHGEFLAGLNVVSHPFEDWLWVERLRLKAMAQTAYLDLLRRDAEGDDTELAISTATGLLRVEPTQEQGHRALMRLYRRIGRRAEALQQFQRCGEVLERELDTEPSRETVDLARRIRADLEGPERNGALPDDEAGEKDTPAVRPLQAPRKTGTQTLILMVTNLAGVESLYARLDPLQLAAAQDRFTSLAGHQVIRSGGQVLAHAADSVLACFGYPELSAADLDRAISVAQDIAARLFDITDETALSPRVGIARGKVLLRADAFDRAQVVGFALRQAENLAFSGKSGDVVISADLRSRIGMAYEADDIPIAVSRDGEPANRGYLVRPLPRRG